MKFYFAGMYGYLSLLPKDLWINISPRFLISFYEISPKGFEKFISLCPKNTEIFLDCGAFSAWSKGVVIDIDDYAKFILANRKFLTIYPNLDVIGDAEKTLENQKYLEKKYNLHPLPVFHVTTQRWDILEYYIANYDYIAIGALVGIKMQRKLVVNLLDNVFARIKKSPITKLHGFGFTAYELLKKYPFYSIDSTTWLSPVRYGSSVIIDFKKIGLENYTSPKLMRYELYDEVNRWLLIEKQITQLWQSRNIKW